MFKTSLIYIFLYFSLVESQSVKQYADASCSTLVATIPLTLGKCIDSSSGGSSSSMRYTVCNQTIAITEGFPNNNCAGSVMFTLSSIPGVCQNQMIFTCNNSTPSPSPPSPPSPSSPSGSSNGWLVTIKSYKDDTCQTFERATTATVGICKDFSTSPQNPASGMFLSCNSSTINGNMYFSNNCAGNSIGLSSVVGKCVDREIVICAPVSFANNIKLSLYLISLIFILFI